MTAFAYYSAIADGAIFYASSGAIIINMDNGLDEAHLIWVNSVDRKLYYAIAGLIVGFLPTWFSLCDSILTAIEDDNPAAILIPSEIVVLICLFTGVLVVLAIAKLIIILFAKPQWLETKSGREKCAFNAKMPILPKSSKDGFLCLCDEGLGWAEKNDKKSQKIHLVESWSGSTIKNVIFVKKGLILDTIRINFTDKTFKILRVTKNKELETLLSDRYSDISDGSRLD